MNLRQPEFDHDLIKTVIENLQTVIIVLDLNTEIVYANTMAEMFSGKSRNRLSGLRGGVAFNCIHANDHADRCGFGPHCKDCMVRSTVEKTLSTGQNHSNVEARVEFTDKGEKFLTVSTQYLKDHELVIVSLNDITDIKMLEKKKVESEKQNTLIETAGAVCHEMTQPLQIITGYVELLNLHREAYDEKTNTILEKISKSLDRISAITVKLQNVTSYKVKRYLNNQIVDIEAAAGQKDFSLDRAGTHG